MIGTTLGHYKILDKLGAGGMGEVYRAEDTTLKRQVALKVLPPRFAGSQRRLERFQREAEALATLDHPNIVTIHSIEEFEGTRFLTMQLVEGKQLGELIPPGGMSLQQIFEIAIPLADALAAAHDSGVIHRDLKPSNIMVTDQGRVKVLDFGLAKMYLETSSDGESEASTESLTDEGHILGTVPYMSPEQVEGRELGATSDIFSMGVILHQMATGQVPFQGKSPAAILSAILRDTPSSVSDIRTGFPHHLDRIVRLCIQKHPEKRLQSARDVRNELESLSEEVETGQPLGPPPRRRIWFGRSRWAMVASGLALALLIGAWLVFFRAPPPLEAAPQAVAVLPFANLTGLDEREYLSEGISAGLIQRLSELRHLRLVSRSEVWSYRGRGLSPRKMAEKLGVNILIEGDVQGVDDRLRVNVAVSEPDQSAVLWSESFEIEKSEVLSLQREIAQQLTMVLSLPLSRAERHRIRKDPSRSLAAYDLYLKGAQKLEETDDPRSADRAADLFRQAARSDPDFALAHAGLSTALWWIYQRDVDLENLEEAEAEARASLDIDPDLPAAKIALARVYQSRGRYEDSVAEIQAVLSTHPRPDDAQRSLAFGFERLGELDRARQSYDAAVALGNESWFNWNALGAFLARMGDYAEAAKALDRAIQLAPARVIRPQLNRALVATLEDDSEGALSAYQQIDGPIRNANLASNIGTAYYFSDRSDGLEQAEEYFRVAAQLNSNSHQIQANLGDVLVKLGKDEEARPHYRQAQALVERRLEAMDVTGSTPAADWQILRLQRSLYAAKLQDCTLALEPAEELRRQIPETAYDLHDLASVFALCGKETEALETLGRAIELGYTPELIAREDEFRSLHGSPQFQQLVEQRASIGQP